MWTASSRDGHQRQPGRRRLRRGPRLHEARSLRRLPRRRRHHEACGPRRCRRRRRRQRGRAERAERDDGGDAGEALRGSLVGEVQTAQMAQAAMLPTNAGGHAALPGGRQQAGTQPRRMACTNWASPSTRRHAPHGRGHRGGRPNRASAGRLAPRTGQGLRPRRLVSQQRARRCKVESRSPTGCIDAGRRADGGSPPARWCAGRRRGRATPRCLLDKSRQRRCLEGDRRRRLFC
mmetsp:Transcript_153694/g.492733  ORF Transcript_153694/g.492733 Transcript_153694/m.492733 type:complete len:234 (+) Transcript_153694:261-962(+)